jgi:hypothetical protein
MKTVRCDFCGEPIEEGNEGDSVYIGDPEDDESERDACGPCLDLLARIGAAHNLPAVSALLGWKDGQDVVPAPHAARQLTVGQVIAELSKLDPALLAWNENDNGDLGAVVGVTVETDDAVEPGAVIQQARANE